MKQFTIAASVALLALGLSGIVLGWPAGFLGGVVSALTGIVVGCGVFYAFSRLVFGRMDEAAIRVVSGLVSGVASGAVGIPVALGVVCNIWSALQFGPHPETYGGDTVYIFIVGHSIICSMLAGVVFGTGIGQACPRRPEEPM